MFKIIIIIQTNNLFNKVKNNISLDRYISIHRSLKLYLTGSKAVRFELKTFL